MTFSIAARCPETRMVGVAVSTALLCVGQLCPFPRAAVGAISTQSFVNPYLGLRGLDYLADGMAATAVRDRLAAEDEGRAIRQFTVVDRDGGSAAYSGVDCVPWPVAELRRIWGLYNQGFGEIVRMMPTKAHPAGTFALDAIRPFLPE